MFEVDEELLNALQKCENLRLKPILLIAVSPDNKFVLHLLPCENNMTPPKTNALLKRLGELARTNQTVIVPPATEAN